MKTSLISGERFYSLEESNLVKEIFKKAVKIFEAFGYDYINLSHFEPYEFQELTFGEGSKEAITFKDSYTKESFGLRLDFTTQVVRTISHLRNVKLPERVYYFGKVFSLDRRGFEKLQTGVELIGEKSILADFEVIQVLTEFLKSLGLKDLKVILSHAGIVRKVADEREELLRTFSERNLEALKEVLGNDIKFFVEVSKNPEVLNFLEKYDLEKEKEELLELGKLLEEFGIDYAYDLGEVRNFPYYTGVIFEIYELKSGKALAGGGRYDNLSKIYGKEYPATGGAVYLERLLDILPKNVEKKDYFVIDKTKKRLGLKLADVLREKGKKVGMEIVKERGLEHSLIYAFDKGFKEVLLVEDEIVKVYTTPKDYVVMKIREFLDLIE